MNMLTALLGRILAGEPYEPASKRDSRIWLSMFAAFPVPIMVAFLTAPVLRDASLPVIWFVWVVVGIGFAGLWLLLFRTFQLKILGLVAACAWACAFAIAFLRA